MRALRHLPRPTLLLLSSVGLLAGCGSEDGYKNLDRPPSPIVLTASISKDRVSVSPAKFGAGPVSLIITNQTQTAQQITLSGPDGLSQQTGPISPRDTATLKVDITTGTATVSAGSGIDAARLTVGPERESAQNQLLQP